MPTTEATSLLAQETLSPTYKSKQTQTSSPQVSSARRVEQNDSYAKAVELISKRIKAGSNDPYLFYERGCWSFRLGNIQESLHDFDRFIELVPSKSNSQWQRGITCYYAEQFEAGAKQFVDYQTYHDNDVENAVWRYLCQMKFDGKQNARRAILPIKNDPRLPMMEIYRLFQGQSTPDKVLSVLATSNSTGPRAKHERFDGHLYLGLYFDSENDLPNAKKHIELAVKQFDQGDYMWSVAVQHQKQLDQRTTKLAREKTTLDD